MIRKALVVILAAAGLSACASYGTGYRGGVGGDYYYGRASSVYHYGSPYGYGYPYGGYYGYGRYGYYGYPHYYYRPPYYHHPRPPHEPQPRTVVVPNKRIPGIEYPPGAVVYPRKPGLDPFADGARISSSRLGSGNAGSESKVRSRIESARPRPVAPSVTRSIAPPPVRASIAPSRAAPTRIGSGVNRIRSSGSGLRREP